MLSGGAEDIRATTCSARVACGKWHLPAAGNHSRGPFHSDATRYAPSASPTSPRDRCCRRVRSSLFFHGAQFIDDPLDMSAAWRERSGWRGWGDPMKKLSGGGQVPLANTVVCQAGYHAHVPAPPDNFSSGGNQQRQDPHSDRNAASLREIPLSARRCRRRRALRICFSRKRAAGRRQPQHQSAARVPLEPRPPPPPPHLCCVRPRQHAPGLAPAYRQ